MSILIGWRCKKALCTAPLVLIVISSDSISMLAGLELWLALLGVGRYPLFGIFALEQELLELTLDRQALGERDLRARLHGALDTPDGFGCLVGWAERLRVAHDLVPVVLRLVDIVDQAELLCLFEAEQFALCHQFDGLVLGQRARQALRTAGSRQHTERYLWEADLASTAPRNTNIAGQRDLQATADCVTVERRDYQLGRLLQAYQRLIGVQAKIVLKGRSHSIEHADLSAGAKELLSGAAQQQHMDILIEARLQD